MSLISVSDLWRVFEWVGGERTADRKENRRRLEGWLDGVHRELSELSAVWLAMLEPAEKGQLDKGTNAYAAIERMAPKIVHLQEYLVGMLREFYRATSSVLGADNPFQEDFVHKLADILITRDKARAAYDKVGVDDWNVEELRRLTSQLLAQVAALRVAIESFKAAPDK